MERIKLIWDFHGAGAAKTAAHHVLHLEEFVAADKLQNAFAASEALSETHHIAFLVVEKAEMERLRETLKPPRGQLYAEK